MPAPGIEKSRCEERRGIDRSAGAVAKQSSCRAAEANKFRPQRQEPHLIDCKWRDFGSEGEC